MGNSKYVEFDSVCNTITIDDEQYRVNTFILIEATRILLTEKRFLDSLENDFVGFVSSKRVEKFKQWHESKKQIYTDIK